MFMVGVEDRRKEPSRTEIIEREMEAVAERICRVCQHLPKEEFTALIRRMAEIDVKYRMRRSYET